MNKLFNSEIDLKLRLFYVLAWTGCIANTIGYVSNALLYGLSAATLFPFFCALIIYAASAYGIHTGKTRVPALLILSICNLVEFPVLYCLYGPYRLSYMILGIVATALFLEDAWRIAGTSLLMLFDCMLIIWKMVRPDFFSAFVVEENLLSAVITFLIASGSIISMLTILLRQYAQQQKCMQQMTEDLQLAAHLDPLTRLYNQRYLTQYLTDKISDGEVTFAVVLLDIDNFKQINDTYGHMFGDEVLQSFSQILLKHMKGHGIVTRFGGEEFMLVFNSVDKSSMQQILSQCASDFNLFGLSTKKRPMTFSGGVAIFHNEDMLVKLFNQADERLYEAKHTGKQHVVYE